jgi:hypothetical protein
MRIGLYIIQIFIACLLISCAPANDKLLSSLLYLDGCTSACWVGIEVGKSSFDQTKTILENRYTDQNTDVILDFMLWRTNDVDSSYGTVTFSHSVVENMLLFFENSKFTAKDIINVLGEPSDVMISIEVNESQLQCARMQLSYPDIGVQAYLDTTLVFKGVAKSQLITGFRFMSSKALQDLQLNVQRDGIAMVVDWQGYKDYCEMVSLVPKSPQE